MGIGNICRFIEYYYRHIHQRAVCLSCVEYELQLPSAACHCFLALAVQDCLELLAVARKSILGCDSRQYHSMDVFVQQLVSTTLCRDVRLL